MRVGLNSTLSMHSSSNVEKYLLLAQKCATSRVVSNNCPRLHCDCKIMKMISALKSAMDVMDKSDTDHCFVYLANDDITVPCVCVSMAGVAIYSSGVTSLL